MTRRWGHVAGVLVLYLAMLGLYGLLVGALVWLSFPRMFH